MVILKIFEANCDARDEKHGIPCIHRAEYEVCEDDGSRTYGRYCSIHAKVILGKVILGLVHRKEKDPNKTPENQLPLPGVDRSTGPTEH